MVEYGLISLADHLADPVTGERVSQRQRLIEIVDQIVLAESLGIPLFGVGEHHFGNYILPSPELVLAMAAGRTTHITLGTSVSLLANVDPVRYAEKLSVLDVLSNGRAEAVFARGASERTAEAFGIHSFDELRPRFDESLRLVLRLLSEDEVTWDGEYRTGLDGVRIEPRAVQKPYPTMWVGGGLSNVSADLAADLGLPLMLPSLFRWPSDYVDIANRYRERSQANGFRPRVGFPSYLHVAKTSQEAKARWQPRLEYYSEFAMEIRGAFGRPTDFDSLLLGPALCGSPAEVAERIGEINRELSLDRHQFLIDVGGLPYPIVAEVLELLATEVLPQVP
ncbi:MAG: LLM class flavin-dependent oxidoreductase [Acidimicrobiales bacterium]